MSSQRENTMPLNMQEKISTNGELTVISNKSSSCLVWVGVCLIPQHCCKLSCCSVHWIHLLGSFMLQDSQEVFTSLYTMKWFFQCFLDRVSKFTANARMYQITHDVVCLKATLFKHGHRCRWWQTISSCRSKCRPNNFVIDWYLCVQTPFNLTLRIWDIYIFEGERVLPAMSYTVLKLHKSKLSLLH